MDLPAVTNLDDHWGFVLQDGRTIEVVAAEEALEATNETMTSVTECCCFKRVLPDSDCASVCLITQVVSCCALRNVDCCIAKEC